MAKKNKFPKTLLAMQLDDGVIIVSETPEDISEEFADDPVGIYELIAVGKFNVEKSVDGKLVKKAKVGKK